MPALDFPLETLRSYRGSATAPADLGDFWDATLADARKPPLDVVLEPVETGLALIDTFDVTFTGFGGARIRGWLHVPAGPRGDVQAQPLPAVVQYAGYSGGRGLPHQDTVWAQAGWAMLIMDTRGQGYGGISGDTPDPHPSAGGIAYPGLMTRGIQDPEDYYYRRLYTDAVRAIEAAQALDAVDSARIVVHGVSQGGGLAIAAASLAARAGIGGVIACLPDVNFLSDFRRALDVATAGPYPEIERFLVRHREMAATALRTLDYFDVSLLARWATAPASFSVALRDEVCPPSTVYAAFNNYGEDSPERARPAKDITEWPFNNHEGGGEHQVAAHLRRLAELRSST
ncbi:acetylxylan esterase [Sinomonas sp. ASV486]|uniref:acetylxylan esterase n=1 Tax=Sinomonas sp. ASV486 TaxID=3051170 RepID=UPI0027DAFDD1|nr:acetylxylan esterase [Sinomonas sp. ASV486]MDQ4491199.1 acetylxylan esterase [Sinomonas sp. ASV486]MDQ4491859.1 acetylxylan esterase [Sinomonas sp. ASV486]MDQ4491973.1 acetylxylan esterase [Sinomonas sp. ASV486]